ncbi:type III-A CRISPR-associated RAMP protein Csm3 [Caldicellulosiruptor changbaiensis]|nr:type III-A CRISPR-associated RAMP protein Csm3 [Caldicellulosiruptor changbaiensis]
MENNEMLLKQIIVLKTIMKIKTGLRIGGSREELKIGDIDNPVIRDPLTNEPYIPGSSLKGKMRSSLEITLKGTKDPCNCGNCPICVLFGAAKNKPQSGEKEVTRLIVRDSFMTEKSKKLLLDFVGDYVEIKKENVINRVTGVAKDPRTLDRIPAGTEFECEFVLRIYQKDQEKVEEYIKYIETALTLIELTYLGGSGTRGYGKVEFGENGNKIIEKKVYEIVKSEDGFVKVEEKSEDS